MIDKTADDDVPLWFELMTLQGLTSNPKDPLSDIPDGMMKDEAKKFISGIPGATNEDLQKMIEEASDISNKEEVLAREFVKRGLDISVFLEKAKFRSTKAILRKEIS